MGAVEPLEKTIEPEPSPEARFRSLLGDLRARKPRRGPGARGLHGKDAVSVTPEISPSGQDVVSGAYIGRGAGGVASGELHHERILDADEGHQHREVRGGKV